MVMKGYHMGLFTPIPRSRGSEVEMRLLCVECEISLSNWCVWLLGAPAKPVSDFSFEDGGDTGSSSAVRGDSLLLDENGTSVDHAQPQTSSSVALLPPAMLDSHPVDELNLLPVCEAKVMNNGGFCAGSVKTAYLHSGNPMEESASENDDVIITGVADNDDARVTEVQVTKGALGLGFCLAGGRDSVAGNRPVSVKRLFQGIVHFWPPAKRPGI